MKEIVFFVLYVLFSLCVSFLDIKKGEVSRLLLWSAIIFVLLFKAVTIANFMLIGPLSGGMLGIGIFLLAYYFSGKKLGLADVWYAGLVGSIFGPFLFHAVLGISCILGIVFIKVSKKQIIPFIPFMAAGSFILLPVLFQQSK